MLTMREEILKELTESSESLADEVDAYVCPNCGARLDPQQVDCDCGSHTQSPLATFGIQF